jgi:hypothetical protein
MAHEAVILVRIDDMEALRTVGTLSIRLPLTEVGPGTFNELVSSALRGVPDPVHDPEKWQRY